MTKERDVVERYYRQVADELCDGREWCWYGLGEPLQRFAQLMAKHEREACAKMCDTYAAVKPLNEYSHGSASGAELCAAAIRARRSA